MNEPPGARARVALTGLTVAEYFRDKEGQDVLFSLIISLDLPSWLRGFSFIGSYPQLWAISLLSYRYGRLKKNYFNRQRFNYVREAIYVADDLTDPAPATSFSHLDATTVLSRQMLKLEFIRLWTH